MNLWMCSLTSATKLAPSDFFLQHEFMVGGVAGDEEVTVSDQGFGDSITMVFRRISAHNSHDIWKLVLQLLHKCINK